MIGVESLQYSADFQIRLLACLLNDAEFLRDAVAVIRPTDFSISSCALVWEVCQKFHMSHQARPPNEILYELVSTGVSTTGMYFSSVSESEYTMLNYVMQSVYTWAPDSVTVQYYRAELPKYLQYSRIANLQATTGGSTAALVEGITKVTEELRSVSSTDIKFTPAMAAIPEPEEGKLRLGTGLNIIDRYINGGLEVGQTGMIVACTGVGKTTGMINFAVNCTLRKRRGLFITLELPGDKIAERYQSMLMHMDASLFQQPRSSWSVRDLDRIKAFQTPDFPFYRNIDIFDASIKATNVAMIESTIRAWQDQQLRLPGVRDDDCMVVFLDWLEKIDDTGVRGVTRNTNDATKYKLILEAIGEVARRNKVIIWTATQATRSAIGREILRLDHTAHSVHAHDPLDFSFGLAPVPRPGESLGTGEVDIIEYNDDDMADGKFVGENMAPCDRHLTASLFKTRYSQAVGKVCRFYQGRTLRFWDRDTMAARTDRLVAQGKYLEYLIGSARAL